MEKVSRFHSPLRYPGGKNRLCNFFSKIVLDNSLKDHYIEPYCGGGAVGLSLLINGYMKRITLNDKDLSIYAFWHSMLNKTEELCNAIEKCNLNINEWKKQKQIQHNKKNQDLFKLGFSTFYLNRTNRSGIINSGVIGGINQNGNYLMNSRFNKNELIQRILKIGKMKDQISLHNEDAMNLIDKINTQNKNESHIFYFDPPYYCKGNTLYMNHYKHNDHFFISNKIKKIENASWIVSYDNMEEIKRLYLEYPSKEFVLNHSANKSKKGKEIMFFSKDLIQPEIIDYKPTNFKKMSHNKKIVYKSN